MCTIMKFMILTYFCMIDFLSRKLIVFSGTLNKISKAYFDFLEFQKTHKLFLK